MSEEVATEDIALPDLSTLRPESFQLPSGDPWSLEAAEANGVSDFTPVVEVAAKPEPVKAEPNFHLEDEPLWEVSAPSSRQEEATASTPSPAASIADWIAVQKAKWSDFTSVNPLEDPLKWLNTMRSHWTWVLAGAWLIMFLLDRQFTLIMTLVVLLSILAGIWYLANGAKAKARAKEKAREHQEARAKKMDTPLPRLDEGGE